MARVGRLCSLYLVHLPLLDQVFGGEIEQTRDVQFQRMKRNLLTLDFSLILSKQLPSRLDLVLADVENHPIVPAQLDSVMHWFKQCKNIIIHKLIKEMQAFDQLMVLIAFRKEKNI